MAPKSLAHAIEKKQSSAHRAPELRRSAPPCLRGVRLLLKCVACTTARSLRTREAKAHDSGNGTMAQSKEKAKRGGTLAQGQPRALPLSAAKLVFPSSRAIFLRSSPAVYNTATVKASHCNIASTRGSFCKEKGDLGRNEEEKSARKFANMHAIDGLSLSPATFLGVVSRQSSCH